MARRLPDRSPDRQGFANPIGAIWAGAMLMQHLGPDAIHDSLLSAIETAVS